MADGIRVTFARNNLLSGNRESSGVTKDILESNGYSLTTFPGYVYEVATTTMWPRGNIWTIQIRSDL